MVRLAKICVAWLEPTKPGRYTRPRRPGGRSLGLASRIPIARAYMISAFRRLTQQADLCGSHSRAPGQPGRYSLSAAASTQLQCVSVQTRMPCRFTQRTVDGGQLVETSRNGSGSASGRSSCGSDFGGSECPRSAEWRPGGIWGSILSGPKTGKPVRIPVKPAIASFILHFDSR